MLVQKFNGQKVPGRLLGVDQEVILPKFEDVEENIAFLKRTERPKSNDTGRYTRSKR